MAISPLCHLTCGAEGMGRIANGGGKERSSSWYLLLLLVVTKFNIKIKIQSLITRPDFNSMSGVSAWWKVGGVTLI
jgi:hypothetical protein